MDDNDLMPENRMNEMVDELRKAKEKELNAYATVAHVNDNLKFTLARINALMQVLELTESQRKQVDELTALGESDLNDEPNPTDLKAV